MLVLCRSLPLPIPQHKSLAHRPPVAMEPPPWSSTSSQGDASRMRRGNAAALTDFATTAEKPDTSSGTAPPRHLAEQLTSSHTFRALSTSSRKSSNPPTESQQTSTPKSDLGALFGRIFSRYSVQAFPRFQVLSISVLSSPSHGYEPFSYHPNLHIIVKIKLWSGKDWIYTYAMIDSGASTSFVDIRWAKRFIPHLLTSKSTPFQVSLGDGELGKTCRVTEEVQAKSQSAITKKTTYASASPS